MGRAHHALLLVLGVWLTTFCHSVTAQCSAAESAALLKFKSVVLDPRGDLATWTGEGANCCSWRGVECSRSGVGALKLLLDPPVGGQTVTLDPNNPSASATAGAALASLTQLVILQTDWVAWRGPLPLPEISKLPLRELVIRNGALGNRSPPQTIGGALQNDIGGLAGSLEVLILANTNYNSGLPSALCRLAKLRVLEVSGSLISNLGPACLNNITGLQEVRFTGNRKVTGGLPVWPTALKSLKVLDFSNNAHSGNIPVQYGKFGSVELHLAGNHLAGKVPVGLSSKPVETFRPGNEKLCGTPLPACPA